MDNVDEGWIKIYRNLKEKAIWTCSTPVQKTILLTILMNVNYRDKEWIIDGKKVVIKAGQMYTSLENLTSLCGKGVTQRNLRTALEHFQKFGFLTNQSTKRGRLITVVNWGFYQGGSEKLTKQLTDDRQSTDKGLTITKERKKERNKEYIYTQPKKENKFCSFPQNDYDMEEYEKSILGN